MEEEKNELRSFFQRALIPQDVIEEYIENYFCEGFLISDLCDINEADLSRMNITKGGHIKRILGTVKKTQKDAAAPILNLSNDNIELKNTVAELCQIVESLCIKVTHLSKDVKFHMSLSAFIYVGEAATIVRDFIRSISNDPSMLNQFKTSCQLTEENLKDLLEQTQKYPKARDAICHVNNKKIESFSIEELKKCYDTLGLDQNQIFSEL